MPTRTEHVDVDADSRSSIDRRVFLRKSAFSAVAVGALAACNTNEKDPMAGMAHAAPATPTPNASPSPAARAQQMDEMHEKGIKAFPAKTQGKGCQLLEPRLDRGVKVYDLVASEMRWEVAPGQTVPAMA